MKVSLDLTMPENPQLNQSGEFASPRWSIISAERCEASGLSYAEATEKLRALSATQHGLCIVTDAAANRLTNANGATEADKPEDLSRKTFSELL